MQTIQIASGSSVQITIPNHGAAGFRLDFKVRSNSDAVIQVLFKETILPLEAKFGDCSQSIYTITGINNGVEQLTFFEHQPWNTEVKPNVVEEFTISVT